MASYRVGAGYATDMGNINYSVLFNGIVIRASKNVYQIDLGDGVADFRGSGFKYAKDGTPIGGTVEGYAGYMQGDIVASVGGFEVSVKAFVAAASTIGTADDYRLLAKMFSGNDTLAGNSNSDRLIGFGGKDKMYGGGAYDDLWGGKGADRFIYLETTDSEVGNGDTISDFRIGQGDRIDISRMTDAFFVGSAGQFSGTRAEVGFVHFQGDTVVYVDADGDGAADSEITLEGTINLTASDFIL